MTEEHTIRKGQVILFHRDGSDRWQSRFNLPNRKGWTYQSTGTTDLEEAKENAGEYFDEIRLQVKHNIAAEPMTIRPVAESVMADLEAQLKAGTGKPTYKTYVQYIRKYILPFFGKTSCNSLDHKTILRFQDFCRDTLGRDLTRSHVNHINTALRRVFDEALKQGHIQANKIPKLRNYGDAGKRQPTFEPEELRRIGKYFEQWCEEPVSNKRVTETRKWIWCFAFFSALTGIRPGTELTEELKWKDIDENWTHNGKAFVKIQVRKGKTHKTYGVREVIAKPEIDFFLWKLREINPHQQPEDYVFRISDGTFPRNPNRIFAKVLKDLDLRDGNGGRRRLYSMRHFYITQQILNGVDIHVIARQCGTSTAMNDKYYSQVISTLAADKLSRNWANPVGNIKVVDLSGENPEMRIFWEGLLRNHPDGNYAILPTPK